MRFKKGNKVEVLTQKEVPSGSWRPAEILCGNGHNYTVRYDGNVGHFGEQLIERVPRKVIRPCPPSMDVLVDCVPGEVVEVFHNFSWKMATVLAVLGRDHLLVRLLGLATDFKADKYDVRARLCWQDGEWIVIGKASSKCEDLRFRLPSSRKCSNPSQKMDSIVTQHIKCNYLAAIDNNNVMDSQAIPSRTLKRKPSQYHSEIEAWGRPRQKIRLRKRESTKHEFTQSPEKLDGMASSREMVGSEMILEREKSDGALRCSRLLSLEYNDDENVSSSVGSCSVHTNNTHKLHRVVSAGSFEDNDSQCSDAESFCQLRYGEGDCLLPAKEGSKEEIHRLELHAYRCTIGALHASGPLSWEQEMLLTNLRDSLHISNDEHLMEIRNLVSSRACIPSS